jgi:predicted hydrocarbon binding protein
VSRRRPAELFSWDEQRGTIVFAPANRRVFIINAHAWGLIEDDLLAHFHKGASPLLLEMGTAYGRAIALDYRSVEGDPENVTSFFEHLGLASGWGRFSISGDLAKGSKITVKVSDCVFCESRNLSAGSNDQCHFIVGVCKGIADVVFGFPHFASETKCRSRGDGLCEIVVGRATGSEGAARTSGPDPMTDASQK